MKMMRRSLAIVVALLGMLAVPSVAPAQGAWWNTTPEVNKDLPPGLMPYHEVAPRLREIERRSNRVQVEVIGQSAQGRDLYLVTVSEPSAQGRFGRYKALRNLMLRDPERAQERAAEFEDFKVPVFVNGNIHGNEWEGIDGVAASSSSALAIANDPATKKILENTLYFNGPEPGRPGPRHRGQRQRLRRQPRLHHASQPESRAIGAVDDRVPTRWCCSTCTAT